uniref:PI3K/PI4K catalytic domain-containing protein n=1 Tax=Panagrolaimus superbus TaxID=310955 RepID=A0A914ZC82_9BILA
MNDDFILFEKCVGYDREKVKQVLVQLNFLAAFLSIGDLHITNFGIKKNGKLIVFDFMCSNVPDAQKSFLDDCLISFNGEANIHIDEFFKLCRELLKQCETTERIRIAKLAIGEWELLDKIDVARKIMSDQKLFLNEEQQINYDKGTKELDDYVSKIRANIQKFMEKGMQT